MTIPLVSAFLLSLFVSLFLWGVHALSSKLFKKKKIVCGVQRGPFPEFREHKAQYFHYLTPSLSKGGSGDPPMPMEKVDPVLTPVPRDTHPES